MASVTLLTAADFDADQPDATDQQDQDADEDHIASDIGTGTDMDIQILLQRLDVLVAHLALGFNSQFIVADGNIHGRPGKDGDRCSFIGLEAFDDRWIDLALPLIG